MKEVKKYECEKCGNVYDSADKANNCERFHSDIVSLGIVDADFHGDDGDYRNSKYPTKILLEDVHRSGDIAEYRRIGYGSVEDFALYHEEEEIDGP